MSKCTGCGVELQNKSENNLGYVKDISKALCERCFRIINYNEYKVILKDNQDYIDILKNINIQNDLVVLVVDLFNINYNLETIGNYINKNILLVINKRDILPKSLYDLNIINYFKNYNINIIDSVIISSVKNYGFDELYNKLNKYKTSDRVYVVGFTNSGKSTMINRIIYNYSSNNIKITTSNLPSTTIDSIEVKINDDLTLIDTPGLLDEGDIVNYIDSTLLKRIIPKKELKPITYQIKVPQTIIVDDIFKLNIDKKNSLTLYISNDLKIDRYYKKIKDLDNLEKHIIHVQDDSDIVIQGLGFIHIIKECDVEIYTIQNVRVFTRKSLV